MLSMLLLLAAFTAAADIDDDGVSDARDNCPYVENPGQGDDDGDGWGDACDLCPRIPDYQQQDADGDGEGDACQPDVT